MIGQALGLLLTRNDVDRTPMVEEANRSTVLDLHVPKMSELIFVERTHAFRELRAGLEQHVRLALKGGFHDANEIRAMNPRGA